MKEKLPFVALCLLVTLLPHNVLAKCWYEGMGVLRVKVCDTSFDRVVDDVSRETGNVYRDITRETTNAVDELVRMARNGEIPTPVTKYHTFLRQQARGRWKRIPDELIPILSRYYPERLLRRVRYAENIQTVHGQTITVGDQIFFSGGICLWGESCYSSFHLLLHELEHVDQYERIGGITAFTTRYILNSALSALQGMTRGVHSIHDNIGLEEDAENKANRIVADAWDRWRSKVNLIRTTPVSQTNNPVYFYCYGVPSFGQFAGKKYCMGAFKESNLDQAKRFCGAHRYSLLSWNSSLEAVSGNSSRSAIPAWFQNRTPTPYYWSVDEYKTGCQVTTLRDYEY